MIPTHTVKKAIILLSCIASFQTKSSHLDDLATEIDIPPPKLGSPSLGQLRGQDPQGIIDSFKKPMPSIPAPSTKAGRFSLTCYLACIECGNPWLRCTVLPLVGIGLTTATTTFLINILETAGLIDNQAASAVATACAGSTIILKSLLAFAYYLMEWNNTESRYAAEALKAQNTELLGLVHKNFFNLLGEKRKKWAHQGAGEEEIQQKAVAFQQKHYPFIDPLQTTATLKQELS